MQQQNVVTIEEVIDSYKRNKTITKTAGELNVARSTVRRKLQEGGFYHKEDDIDLLKKEKEQLKNELKNAKKHQLDQKSIRKFIFRLSNESKEIPNWVVSTPDRSNTVAPCVMLSDIHMGEVIEPSQMLYSNQYNESIAKERLELWTLNVVDILKNKINFDYNGITVNLNGDFLSGNIHDELTASNEKSLMQSLLTMQGELIKVLNTFADNFGRVFVAGCPGNHGRNTQKKVYKNKAFSNFDWLLYCLLEQWFQNDDRFTFKISDTDELQYHIFDNFRFRLTHGDQISGGSGITGPVNTIARGNAKKQLASLSYDMDYDYLLLGHFHQSMVLNNCIVNGSLIGYSEFAMQNNMNFEYPKQMLWLVHPEMGVVFDSAVPAVEIIDKEG